MPLVKCETVGKKNKTPQHVLDSQRKSYYERGGRERISAYYKAITPDQRAARYQKCKEWKARNKDRVRILQLACNTKGRIVRQDFEIWDMIGCNCAELAVYLDEQCEPGADWRKGREFEIDHIRPLCSFDLSQLSQIRECLHFSNLQVISRNPHEGKSKKEHMEWMDSKARSWWESNRNLPYPGFTTAWKAFSSRKSNKRAI